MRVSRYIGEGASVKVLVFIVVYMFIFMNNRNRVVEEFREENLEYIRELEQKTDVMSGYLEATSDIASHLYEEHYMHDEDHLDLEDIEEEAGGKFPSG